MKALILESCNRINQKGVHYNIILACLANCCTNRSPTRFIWDQLFSYLTVCPLLHDQGRRNGNHLHNPSIHFLNGLSPLNIRTLRI